MTGVNFISLIQIAPPMTKKGKTHAITDLDKDVIKRIAGKAKQLRVAGELGYEEFALKADINRNTYFKFEKSATTGENFTVATLAKVIRGHNQTWETFFKDFKESGD